MYSCGHSGTPMSRFVCINLYTFWKVRRTRAYIFNMQYPCFQNLHDNAVKGKDSE